MQRGNSNVVFALSYEPTGSSYPRTDLVEGSDELQLEDTTPDGGRLLGSPHFSGRRVISASVPKVIRRYTKRKLQDLEGQFVKTVSDRFRILIEKVEPGVHQFEPVRFIGKDDQLLEERWFWQVCNRLDSVHRELSDARLDGASWRPLENGKWNIIFDLNKIGRAKFWCDKHVKLGVMLTDEVWKELADEEITGLRFTHYAQA